MDVSHVTTKSPRGGGESFREGVKKPTVPEEAVGLCPGSERRRQKRKKGLVYLSRD